MKRDEIKNRIVAVARENFAEFGYKSVSTENIAKSAGISKKTLYEIFPAKADLMNFVVDTSQQYIAEKIKDVVVGLKDNPEKDFIVELERMINYELFAWKIFTKKFCYDIKTYFPAKWDEIIKFRSEQFEKHFFLLFSIGVQKGIINPDINSEFVYLMFLQSYSLTNPEFASLLPLSIDEIVESVYKLFFIGFFTETGRREYEKKIQIEKI